MTTKTCKRKATKTTQYHTMGAKVAWELYFDCGPQSGSNLTYSLPVVCKAHKTCLCKPCGKILKRMVLKYGWTVNDTYYSVCTHCFAPPKGSCKCITPVWAELTYEL